MPTLEKNMALYFGTIRRNNKSFLTQEEELIIYMFLIYMFLINFLPTVSSRFLKEFFSVCDQSLQQFHFQVANLAGP